ncbi:MAG TPA: hypothetical protein VJ124_16540 [Pyrinomonadaceae bacterium]|nr:hypothetical protein [Pyrinomonadaceae bacterium]
MRLAFITPLLILGLSSLSSVVAQTGAGFEEEGRPIYHMTFVQAKPGKDREYRRFARQVFQPMWEEAVKAGIIESWAVYEHPVYFGSNVGYTHIQIVRFKNFAAFDAFIPNLLKITEKMFPGRDLQREAESLMDIVKSDIFHEFASTTSADAKAKPTGPGN